MAEREGVEQHRRSVKGPASAALSKLGLKAGFTFKALSCAGNMLKFTSAITNRNHSPRQSYSSACP